MSQVSPAALLRRWRPRASDDTEKMAKEKNRSTKPEQVLDSIDRVREGERGGGLQWDEERTGSKRGAYYMAWIVARVAFTRPARFREA